MAAPNCGQFRGRQDIILNNMDAQLVGFAFDKASNGGTHGSSNDSSTESHQCAADPSDGPQYDRTDDSPNNHAC